MTAMIWDAAVEVMAITISKTHIRLPDVPKSLYATKGATRPAVVMSGVNTFARRLFMMVCLLAFYY